MTDNMRVVFLERILLMLDFFLDTTQLRPHGRRRIVQALIGFALVLPFSLSADVTVEFDVIARTGETPVPLFSAATISLQC